MNESLHDSQWEADYLESDVVDLAEVNIAALRDVPAPARSARLLDEVRRGRANAMGGENPGRAE